MKHKKFKNAQGIEYQLIWKPPPRKTNASGLCDSPEVKNPKILIDPKLKEKRMLSVLIEECAHAFWFEKPEKEVRKFASTLSKLIYFTGWKKLK